MFHLLRTEIAGITAFCMSLNLIKYSSHLKENIGKKKTKLIEACLFYMLIVFYEKL